MQPRDFILDDLKIGVSLTLQDFPPLDVSLDYFVFLSQWTKNWGFGVSRTIFAAGESAMKNPVKLHENRS